MKVQINQFFFSISNTCMLASGLGLRNNSLVQKIGCVSPVSLHWVLSVVKISDRFTNYLLYLQLFLIYIWLCNVTNYIPVYLTVNSVVHRMFQYIFSTVNLPIPTNARNGACLSLVYNNAHFSFGSCSIHWLNVLMARPPLLLTLGPSNPTSSSETGWSASEFSGLFASSAVLFLG